RVGDAQFFRAGADGVEGVARPIAWEGLVEEGFDDLERRLASLLSGTGLPSFHALVGKAVEHGTEERIFGAAVVLDESEGYVCFGGDGSHGAGVDPAAGQETLDGLHNLRSARGLRHYDSLRLLRCYVRTR